MNLVMDQEHWAFTSAVLDIRLLGVDWDPDIVELARETNRRLDGTVDFQVCDVSKVDKKFGPNSFDAVISDVTLEHFDDGDIIEVLRKQLVVAKLNIFAVHCKNLLPKFFPGLDGGERLYTPSYWEGLIRRAGGEIVNHFGYGYYYTRIGQLNWRVAAIVEEILFRRLGRFAAVTGFVVNRA